MVCPLKTIRLFLCPGTGLCDLTLFLIQEEITSTPHKSIHMTCELPFRKSKPSIFIHLTMLQSQCAVCWIVLRLVYCNKRHRSPFLALCSVSQPCAAGLKYSRRKRSICWWPNLQTQTTTNYLCLPLCHLTSSG